MYVHLAWTVSRVACGQFVAVVGATGPANAVTCPACIRIMRR